MSPGGLDSVATAAGVEGLVVVCEAAPGGDVVADWVALPDGVAGVEREEVLAQAVSRIPKAVIVTVSAVRWAVLIIQ
jgi:hypothetical protein